MKSMHDIDEKKISDDESLYRAYTGPNTYEYKVIKHNQDFSKFKTIYEIVKDTHNMYFDYDGINTVSPETDYKKCHTIITNYIENTLKIKEYKIYSFKRINTAIKVSFHFILNIITNMANNKYIAQELKIFDPDVYHSNKQHFKIYGKSYIKNNCTDDTDMQPIDKNHIFINDIKDSIKYDMTLCEGEYPINNKTENMKLANDRDKCNMYCFIKDNFDYGWTIDKIYGTGPFMIKFKYARHECKICKRIHDNNMEYMYSSKNALYLVCNRAKKSIRI